MRRIFRVSGVAGALVAVVAASAIVASPVLADKSSANPPTVEPREKIFRDSQPWTVPDDVYMIEFEMDAGSGGDSVSIGGPQGGRGGSIKGSAAVSPKQTLGIWVGEEGGQGENFDETKPWHEGYGGNGGGGYRVGGYGRAANGAERDGGNKFISGGGGGGGSSAITPTSEGINAIAVAPGGGGAGGRAGYEKARPGYGGSAGQPGSDALGCTNYNSRGGVPGSSDDADKDGESAEFSLSVREPRTRAGGGGGGGAGGGHSSPRQAEKCEAGLWGNEIGSAGGGGGGGAYLAPPGATKGFAQGYGDGYVKVSWSFSGVTTVSAVVEPSVVWDRTVAHIQVRHGSGGVGVPVGEVVAANSCWNGRARLKADATDPSLAVADLPVLCAGPLGANEYQLNFVPDKDTRYQPSEAKAVGAVRLPGNLDKPAVTVKGAPGVGQIFEASRGSWDKSDRIDEYRYQWFRTVSGKAPIAIPGETASTHAALAEDLGASLSVRVTAKWQDFEKPVDALSVEQPVQFASEVGLKLEREETCPACAPIRAVAHVASPVVVAGQKVVFTVLDAANGTEAGKYESLLDQRGDASRVLPKTFAVGNYNVKASYSGNAFQQDKESAPARFQMKNELTVQLWVMDQQPTAHVSSRANLQGQTLWFTFTPVEGGAPVRVSAQVDDQADATLQALPTLASGEYKLTASYEGSDTVIAATSPEVVFSVQ